MTTVTGSTANPLAGLGASTTSPAGSQPTSADAFLTLLVTQMQNQDPLNPMDNAQVTSQMAQINTVNGIEKLNQTVAGLNSQFVQMQALQGASLVGHDVLLAGNTLQAADGTGRGAFELSGAADRVKVEVLGPNGAVIDTLELGAESAGRHSFEWKNPAAQVGTNLSFRVTATSGAATIPSTPLMRDHVLAVGLEGDTLTLELAASGNVPYTAVKAVH